MHTDLDIRIDIMLNHVHCMVLWLRDTESASCTSRLAQSSSKWQAAQTLLGSAKLTKRDLAERAVNQEEKLGSLTYFRVIGLFDSSFAWHGHHSILAMCIVISRTFFCGVCSTLFAQET